MYRRYVNATKNRVYKNDPPINKTYRDTAIILHII